MPLSLSNVVAQEGVSQTDELTVLLDWYVNPDHAPLIIAKQMGIFEDYGLDVDLIPPSDPTMPPKLVAAGQGDIAISYQPQLYLQVAAGLPLMRFATLVDTPLNSIAVLEDGPIQSIDDLKGKVIGYSVAGMEETLLGEILASVGLGLDDVRLVNVNFALTSALASGQVDAVIGAFRNFESTLLELAGTKGRLFFVEEHGVPNHDELIYVTRKELMDDPRLPRFMMAIEQATAYLLNHPDSSWDMFITYDKELDDELNHRAFYDTLRRFSASPGALDIGRYQRFAEFLLEKGLVDRLPPLEDFVGTINQN